MRFDNEIQVCERTVARLQDDRGRSAVRCSREHYLWVASVILGVEKIVGDRGALGSADLDEIRGLIFGAPREHLPRVIGHAKQCADEPSCGESWHVDDGVPYCDKCGFYRQSKHRLGVGI